MKAWTNKPNSMHVKLILYEAIIVLLYCLFIEIMNAILTRVVPSTPARAYLSSIKLALCLSSSIVQFFCNREIIDKN